MPLKVAFLENIFWTNGSYNKPATIPDSSNFETIQVTPVMMSPYVGHVVIIGDYNYAEFKDVLYFLSPIELKDQTRNKIKYLLTRDEWAFAVRNKTKLAGTVVKTLDEKLLTENIQLTQPVIPNPAKLNILNLIEDESHETIVIDPVNLSFPQITLSGRGVEQLINSSPTTGGTVKGLNLILEENWKSLLKPYINKLIDGIRDEKYMLTKVSQIESSFKFFWCLTVDDANKRIGDIKEKDIYIEKIDFSGLTDIEALSISNHTNPAEANTKIDINKAGSAIVKQYDLSLEKAGSKLLITSGSGELLDKQLIKYGSQYYIVDKQEESYLKLIPWPSDKEVWEKNLRTQGVAIERDLNTLDNKLRENRGYRFSSFYAATKNWIKQISPNFKDSEDLNPPIPRKEDGTFDLSKFYEDYLQWEIEFSTTKSPLAIGWWVVFHNRKTRPKFFYELYGTAYKSYFVDPSINIQTLVESIALNTRALPSDPTVLKNNIFNGWYYSIDKTYKAPGPQEHQGKIYSIDEKSLETGMHLYDLIGTDYLLLIYKNEPHLIFQNAQIRAKGRKLSITAQEQIPEFDIFEAINQSNNLQVFNKSFPLKDRITKNYQFNTEIKVITDPNSIAYDYAFVRYQGYLDSICEAIEYPKSKLAASAAVSAVEVENNYIAQQRNYEDLQLKRREALLRRTNEDLEWSFNWEEYGIKRATSLVTFAIGVAAMGAAGLSTGGIAQAYLGTKGAGKLASGISTFMSSSLEYNKLTAAQQQQLQARLLENYSLETTHHRYDYDLKRSLKNMGNVAQAAAVTYRDVMDKYNSEIGANEIHLRIWTPTELQMRTIETLYQETGVDCLIDQVTIQIDENLSGIWRFSVIDAIGSEDGMTISFLTSLFQNGVRIVPNDVVFKKPIQAIQSFLLPEHIKRELGILREKAANSEATERVYKGLISYTNVGLIKEKEEEIQELIKQQKDLEKTSEEYFKQARELKQNLLDKQEQIIQLEEKCAEDIKEAKDTIRRLRKDYEDKALQLKELLRDRNKLAVDLQNKQDELDNCKKQKEDLQAKLASATDLAKQIEAQKNQIEAEAKRLAEEKAAIEKQLQEERRSQTPNLEIIKHYEEQLNDIKEKEKEALDKLNKLQEELKKHETCKDKLTKLNECLEKYKDAYKTIYDKLNIAGYWFFFLTSHIGKLFGAIGAIVKELANNTWSNSKSWHWTTNFLINDWAKELLYKLGSNEKQTVTGKVWGQNINQVISEADKFFRWYILDSEYPQMFVEKYYGKHFQKYNMDSKYLWSITDWWSSVFDTDESLGYFFDSGQDLNMNYPAYKIYNPSTSSSMHIWSQYLEGAITEQVHWGDAVFKIWPKWTIIKPKQLEQCIEDFGPLDIKKTPEHEELLATNEELKQQLTICNNNLERYRTDYAELEKEKTQQQNLAVLYKAEVDKLKKELEEAKKKPDGK